jgi:branched-chain amino acid transport system ATP-binding protein
MDASAVDSRAVNDEIETRNISVRFAGLAAMTDVSIRIRRQEIVGLIGPNGAGKTTLVNCLSGFLRPTSGTILMSGADVTGWTPQRLGKAGIARTFQSVRLFKDLSVVENVEVPAIGLGLSRRKASERAMALLESIGLADKATSAAGALPYTDERRVGMVRALALSPAFILLDEPAAGMSDSECNELMAYVSRIPERFGCGVLLIEHNMRVIMSVCDRIHVLDSGRSIAEGTPDEIQRDRAVISAYLGPQSESRKAAN